MYIVGITMFERQSLLRVELVSDNVAAMEAVLQPREWPRFQNLLDQINQVFQSFEVCEFQSVRIQANKITRAIATSVTRYERFHSYMALGGPTWLHQQVWNGAYG